MGRALVSVIGYTCARELEPVSPAGGRGTTGSFISRMQMSEVKDYSGTMKVWMLAHESSKCNIEANKYFDMAAMSNVRSLAQALRSATLSNNIENLSLF